MRFATFYRPEDASEILTVWSDAANGWVKIEDLIDDLQFADLNDLLIWDDFDAANADAAETESIFAKIAAALAEKTDVSALSWENLEKDGYFFAPPIEPRKILCVGLNYADHAKEFGNALPSEPVIFNKAPSALNAHFGTIRLPKVSNRVDFEGELVVVIGKTCKNVAREDAMKYVAGYCCGNDVSARDWQKGKPGGQWLLGKSFDTFAPLGPAFVTADEVGDPHRLKIETRLNGETTQSSTTANFIFPIDLLVSYVSQVMTLEPGDLIFTGTPNGVGDARKPPVYLKDGDKFEVEIEKIGTLCNICRNEE